VVLVLAGTALLFGLFREPVYTAEAAVSLAPRTNWTMRRRERPLFRRCRAFVVTEDLLWEVMDQTEAKAGIRDSPNSQTSGPS
jgi:hypothetical protein